jgi:hypothetical protein
VIGVEFEEPVAAVRCFGSAPLWADCAIVGACDVTAWRRTDTAAQAGLGERQRGAFHSKFIRCRLGILGLAVVVEEFSCDVRRK